MFDRNILFYGDNLDFLADPDAFPSESVDLIYLDPPFNSSATYNVLFKEVSGEPSAAQIKAFDDTWSWDAAANTALFTLMQDAHTPGELSALIKTFHQFLGHSPMLAYLVQMAVRLIHMRRVLKPTGSLYLHCDSTASHYLKVILDAIFGSDCFLNNIVWLYGLGGSSNRYWPKKHDDILWYSKASDQQYFVADMVPATSQMMSGEMKKAPDFWPIPTINNMARERLGYPTQKPIALLERIVRSSCPHDGVVLDPFCGCGTTIDAVETLNRESPGEPPRIWLGIDVTHLAINLIKHRLARFDPPPVYDVQGEPVVLSGAEQLFNDDAFQFQFWACGLVGARPAGAKAGSKKGKKGADRGIDGVRYFSDDKSGPKAILVQVKGGRTGSADIRDFRGTLERENAAMGIFITLREPTKPMVKEAASAGMHTSPGGEPIPRLQIVTIETLLSGGTPRQPAGVLLPAGALDPSGDRTVKKAKRHDEGALFQKRNG